MVVASPTPMIGMLDHATYSNITELRRSFYVDTVSPYLTLIEVAKRIFDRREARRPDVVARSRTFAALAASAKPK